jgi:hypothetical protein
VNCTDQDAAKKSPGKGPTMVFRKKKAKSPPQKRPPRKQAKKTPDKKSKFYQAMPPRSPRPERWIIIPDLQVPYQDTRSLSAVEKLMSDYTWDGWLQLGDLMDFDCISSHNANNLREVEGKRLLDDYAVAGKLLDKHQSIIRAKNPNAKFVVLEGNHEHRLERFIDANPAVEGMVEIPTALNFRERRITWVPFWSEGKGYEIGNALFIHGLYTNQHHAAKHVSRFNKNAFYGHLHSIQCFSAERYGEESPIVAQSLGNLCLPQKYMRGRPSSWIQAIGVFQFLPDGNFDYHVVRINNHRLIYNGKIYQG